ncbi:MAG: GtrA family protein [Chloroflexi bacterium]|nr:GtrA family protein [Chloroflexota bacterium]
MKEIDNTTDGHSNGQTGAEGLRGRLRNLFHYKIGVRLTSFGLVGVSGLVVNSLILAALTEIGGVHYLLSSIMSTQGSSLWNFGLCEGWVFRDKRADGRTLQRLFLFMLMNNATLLLRAPILFLLTSGLGVHYLLSNFIAISMMALVRFVMSDRWIWNGSQERSNGPITYDIHDIICVESSVPLPELEHFRVQSGSRAPDIRVRAGKSGLQETLEYTATHPNMRTIEYSEGIGPLAFKVRVFLGDTTEVVVSNLVAASPHVLYTNVVEPILRWTFVRKGYALVHGACLSLNGQAVMLSAQTDTGKTTTVLRTLTRYPYSFLSDDMIVLSRDGILRNFPKPLTISNHTLAAVSNASLSTRQRLALQIQSRVHSRSGRRFAHALARARIPVASVNALAQIVIPPPKYRIDQLIRDVALTEQARLSYLVFIEIGDEGEKVLDKETALEVLLRNCEDAYGFPPYTELAGFLLDSFDEDLPKSEAKIIEDALENCPTLLIRSMKRDWWRRLPTIFEELEKGRSNGLAVNPELSQSQTVTP